MQQDWLLALLGGSLIGLAATVLLLFNGRVLGMTGIVSGILKPIKNDTLWRIFLMIGLLGGGLLASQFMEQAFINVSQRSLGAIALAGILVGFGTRMGSGCTSGHGVCGLSRMSPRSLVATISFMAAGMFIVTVISKLLGGV